LSRLVASVIEKAPDAATIRVAIVGSYTTQPIVTAVRCGLLGEGVLANVYEAPFAAYVQEILSVRSGLYNFHPDVVLICATPSARLSDVNPTQEAATEFVDNEVEHWQGLWETLETRLGKPVLQHIFEVPEENFVGVPERRLAWSASSMVETLNRRMLEAAPGFVRWVDVDRLAAKVGRAQWRDARLYYHGKLGFSTRFLPDYTNLVRAALRNVLARSKKALVLDLDNTLWGGVIGDDGLDGIRLGPDSAEGEAYAAFCGYVKELGRRGVILAICSKNDAAIAAEVFQKHPHMPLKLDDFAAIRCNWQDKASNLNEIAAELNIDVSALVFADDNPAECALITQFLPDILSVHLDGDPALFVRKLDELHLFDTQVLSEEDLKRSQSYRARRQALAMRIEGRDFEGYLESLQMRARIRPASAAELPRLAQMEMKTNQFNLSTRRLSASQLEDMIGSCEYVVLAIDLCDRFADHGLVSYVALRFTCGKVVITDWLMSCRVFSRTLELFTINSVIRLAQARDASEIEAVLHPTSKNAVMNGLFEQLGFVCAGQTPAGPWRRKVATDAAELRCFITEDIPVQACL
jgi:FkbH-like protein